MGDMSQYYSTTEKRCGSQVKPFELGESIFYLHHKFDMRPIPDVEGMLEVKSGMMMDDGRIVLCLTTGSSPLLGRLLICNTDGSQTDSIPLQYPPYYVTAVNNSTVAVSPGIEYIEMYDINSKHKLKSIQVPGGSCDGITTINNNVVVRSYGELYIIDQQKEEVVHTINIKIRAPNSLIPCVHATGDRIFYSDGTDKLSCFSCTRHSYSTTTLPCTPKTITSLLDGSLYVLCWDGSVLHVSCDGKEYETVKTEGLTSLNDCLVLSYSRIKRTLVTCTKDGIANVFVEF